MIYRRMLLPCGCCLRLVVGEMPSPRGTPENPVYTPALIKDFDPNQPRADLAEWLWHARAELRRLAPAMRAAAAEHQQKIGRLH